MDNAASQNSDRIESAKTQARPFDALALLHQASVLDSGAAPNTADAHLPAMSFTEFQERADRLLAPITDKATGKVEGDAVRDLVTDKNISGRDAAVAATLYTIFELPAEPLRWKTAQENNSRESDYRDRGATELPSARASLDAFKLHAMVPVSAHEEELQKALTSLGDTSTFKSLDRNGDHRLSAAELASSPAIKILTTEDPGFMARLSQAGAGKGMTASQLAREGESRSDMSAIEELTGYSTDYSVKALASASNRNLYADSANPLNNIKMGDVVQGSAGDCYFDAVLASVAKSNPQIIKDAIKDNKDGTYTVTFKGDPQHPVSVNAPTDAELALYNTAGKDGVWSPVMEKAFATYAHEVLGRPQGSSTLQDENSAGDPSDVMRILTGVDSQTISSSAPADGSGKKGDPATDKQFVDVAVAALNRGDAVTFTTGREVSSDSGLQETHVYSVVGYTHTAAGVTLELRDPRGSIMEPNFVEYPQVRQAQLASVPVELEVARTGTGS